MGRRRLLMVAVLALAAVGVAAWKATARERPLGTVERRDLVFAVDVEGELRALHSVTIGPPQVPNIWNFKIASLVDEGSEVKAGDVVVGFDTTELFQTLREKMGVRDAAAKELEKKTSELAIERQDLELKLAESRSQLRKQALELEVPPELVARQELEGARVDHTLATTEIAALEAELRQLALRTTAELGALRGKRDEAARAVSELQANLQAMQVQAPRAGTVVYATGEEGEKVKMGDTVWRAQSVLEIPDLLALVGDGTVDEAEMGRLATGQPVRLRLDAHPDQAYRGRVAAVRQSVENRSVADPARVARVQIALQAIDRDTMRPGMRFRGEVEVGRVPSVLCLPLAAVEPGTGGPTVRVRRGLGEERVRPRLGRRDAHCVEVLGGLAAGDRVVVASGASG